MHVIVWEFVPKPDCAAEFERLYGPGGEWDALFKRAQGFVGTELLRDEKRPDRYLTVDRWASEAAFRHFRVQFGEQYETLDHECEIMIEQERRIGSFTPVLAE
jgi:heme-degrading monooxygenase HmoA